MLRTKIFKFNQTSSIKDLPGSLEQDQFVFCCRFSTVIILCFTKMHFELCQIMSLKIAIDLVMTLINKLI